MSQVDNIVGCILCEETNTNVEFKIKDENKNGFIMFDCINKTINFIINC